MSEQSELRNKIFEVQKHFSDTGANDSEPNWLIGRMIDRAEQGISFIDMTANDWELFTYTATTTKKKLRLTLATKSLNKAVRAYCEYIMKN